MSIELNNIPALRQLLINPTQDLPFVENIVSDSRMVKPGDLFVSISGDYEDGAKYISQARDAGAKAVLGRCNCDIPVSDDRLALAILAAEQYKKPSEHLLVCGITGTNGKTTSTWLLRDMLAHGGLIPGLITTVATEFPNFSEPSVNTTPGPLKLQETFSRMLKSGCRAVAMEVSSHAIIQQRIAATKFAVASFTNLSQDHLDFHHDMESYYNAKKQFFLKNEKTTAVVNISDDAGCRLVKELKNPLVTFGFSPEADVFADNLQLDAEGSQFDLHFPDKRYFCISALTGRFNVSNILCAAATAYALGVHSEVIVTAIAEAKPKWGRLEQVSQGVFVDYAHTPDALHQVLTTLREVTKGKLWCVFGCGGNRDSGKRSKMGNAVAEIADEIIVTSDNPRNENPSAIISDILVGIKSHKVVIEEDRKTAIEFALANFDRQCDTILVAGKGHETYQEINHVKHHFNDAEIIKEWFDKTFGACGNK